MPHAIDYRFYKLGKALAGLEAIEEETTTREALLPIVEAMNGVETLLEDPLLPMQVRSEALELSKMLESILESKSGLTKEEKIKRRMGYRVGAIKELLRNFETTLFFDPNLSTFRLDHPDPSKCGFLMMPFAPELNDIRDCIRGVCKSLGLEALRADGDYNRRYSDGLLPNIQTFMHGCGFGIAVFSRLEGQGLNPNVSLEVGYMLALGKPVCLLKDEHLELQSDLVGLVYESFDRTKVEDTLPKALQQWLKVKRLSPNPRDLSQ